MIFGTITMKQVRKGMAARKSAYKVAEEKSKKAAIMSGSIKMMRPISVLLTFGLALPALGA